MHLISSVSVEGFWDTHNFEVPINSDVTFFIGPNGTGKTTFINLLAAALTADFRTLDRMPFRKVSIFLTADKKRERPSITVSKSRRKERAFELIDYRINSGGPSGKEVRFSLDDAEEQMILRRMRHDLRYVDYHHRFQTGLLPALSDLVSVKWLSIHRASPLDRQREERTFESSVDQKLESLSNELVRYFATLSRQKDDEMRGFQEHIFVSLIEHRDDINPFDTSRLDIAEQYGEALSTIFKELHVQRDTSSLLADFLRRAVRYRQKAGDDGGLPMDELIFRIGLYRIEEVVRRWEELQDRLKTIFEQRDKFQSIADDLFQRKKMLSPGQTVSKGRTRFAKPL